MGELVSLDQARPPSVMGRRTSSLTAAAQQGVQASFAVIGYKGRNWRLKYRGDEEVLKNGNVPLPHLDVVIVGVSPAISKQWYEKRYTEGSDESPDCFSVDGIQPDASSPKKQCATCAVCPKNRWGSRITDDGKKGKECQDSRRVAVVPLGDLHNESYGGPMLLRLPPMSLSNFANYGALLQRKGADLEFVATRLGFDYDVAYPRITFEAIGWLSEEQALEVVGADGNSGICADEQIARMLQEAVTEATHDPAVAPVEETTDPLAGGGPAPVFGHRRVPAAEAPADTVHEPIRPEPVQQAQTRQQVTEQAYQGAAPAPAKRAASAFTSAAHEAFAGATHSGGAAERNPMQHGTAGAPAVSSPATDATPSAQPHAAAKPPTTIAQAPEDLNAAIDNLLAS